MIKNRVSLPEKNLAFATIKKFCFKKTKSDLEVMSPKGTDFVLTSDIPYSESNVLIFNRFNVEA